jgi:hypothetical protein
MKGKFMSVDVFYSKKLNWCLALYKMLVQKRRVLSSF